YEEVLRRNVERQQALGVDTRMVSIEELQEIQPGMFTDDIGAAAYEPQSGFADPNATTYSFAAAAERSGVRIWTQCEAIRIVRAGDEIVAVETTNGRIATSNVVLAPGAYAPRLLEPLGL